MYTQKTLTTTDSLQYLQVILYLTGQILLSWIISLSLTVLRNSIEHDEFLRLIITLICISLSSVIWIVIVTSENLRQLFPLNLILAILLTICMSLESGVLGICLNFWWKITVWIVAMVLFSIITIISVIMTINLSDHFKSMLFYSIITTIITITVSIDAYFSEYHEFVVDIIGIGMTVSYSPIWLYVCQMSIGNFRSVFINPFFSAELLYFVLMMILYITEIEFIILCKY